MIALYGLPLVPVELLLGLVLVVAAVVSRAGRGTRACLVLGGLLMAFGPWLFFAWAGAFYAVFGLEGPQVLKLMSGMPSQVARALCVLCVVAALVLQVRERPGATSST